jgi:hypothetical protein
MTERNEEDLIFVPLVVGILLNKCNCFCRASPNRALEGLGVAVSVSIQTKTLKTIRWATYLIVSDEGSTSGVISTPFSTTLEMLNTANDIAADIQMEASARRRPVHQKQAMSEHCVDH